jgi:tetratricopeptide (TPR) repeat protein
MQFRKSDSYLGPLGPARGASGSQARLPLVSVLQKPLLQAFGRAVSLLAVGGIVLGSVVLGSVVVGERTAHAAALERLNAECLPEEAYKEVEACPSGPNKFEVGGRRAAAFKTAPPPREKKAQKDDLAQKQAPEEMSAGQRDLRTTRLQARGRALLITEISGLERLYKRTPRRSPDRAQLVRRLAEGYVELESAALRDKIKADIDAEDAKTAKQKAKYDAAKRESNAALQIVAKSRENAIKYYTRMKKDYPDYSKIDEILYYLAYEYEQNKDLDRARNVYLELIEKAPNSPYVPNAYLAFGELFFVEAMGDPSKWALAESAYKEVIKYKPPANKVYGYALYKLGYVYWNSGEYAQAIQEFKNVIEYGDKYADMPNAKLIQKSARRDIIPVYAVAGKASKAFNFFRPLSGDSGGSQELTLQMMRDLGISYYDTGHYEEAITLYRDLMARDKGDQFCEYQVLVSQAVQAISASDKVAIRKELDNMLGVYERFKKEEHSAEAQLNCANRSAELLAETAMSWHLESVGTGGSRGTNDPKTMDLAAYLYGKVVSNFTQEEFSKFTFPRIVKDDWPNIYKIRYAMADLLYVQQRWEDCGPAFDAVVDENPQSEQAPEAAYAAVLCYQKMYDQLHKGESDRKGKGLAPTRADVGGKEKKASEWEKFKPKEFTDMQKGMIGAFNRYVCYIQPPAGNKQAEEQYVEVKYARARTYFEAQHWAEAAIAFRDIALNHSDKDAAVYAGQLYLEAVNVLGAKSEPPKPVCFEEMSKDVPKFIASFCSAEKYAEEKENCDLLTRIQCDIRRLAAEKTVELADTGKGDESLELYKKGGDAYIAIWRDYGEGPLAKGEASQCGRMEEVLYNASRAYQAGRLLAKSIAAKRLLLTTTYGLQGTDLAKKAIYEIGGNYQAIAVYDAAAGYYTRYAEETDYRGEFADQAISDAVVLNLGLGRDDEAIAAAKSFNQNFGRRKPEQAAQIAFAIAAHYAEKEQWKEVADRLGEAMKMIDAQATLDVKVQAHSLLGLANIELNRGAQAQNEYAKVVATWKDPEKAQRAILKDGDDGGPRRLAKALDAVGEAMFYFAEKKRAKLDAIKFPEYKGKGETSDVKKHIETKVKAWMDKKRPMLTETEVEYKKIVDLQPVPSPQWVIAAGSRVGGMWGQFVEEFRAAPIPAAMKKDIMLSQAYYASLDEASEPVKLRAKGAFGTCLDYSVKFQYFDDYSRTCEKWLAENYKSEFHLVDEFKGDPNRVNQVLAERPYPLQLGGEPVLGGAEAKPQPKKAADEPTGKPKKSAEADVGAEVEGGAEVAVSDNAEAEVAPEVEANAEDVDETAAAN